MMNKERKLFHATREDYIGWLRQQISIIEEGRISDLDIEEIKELLISEAKKDERAIDSQLIRLQKHLLKWKYQPNRQTQSWRNSIVNSLIQIYVKLDGIPSLKDYVTIEKMNKTYNRARNGAAGETGLPLKTFPTNPEWTVDELMSHDFSNNWLAIYEKPNEITREKK